MRKLLLLGTVVLFISGCGGGGSNLTGPSGQTQTFNSSVSPLGTSVQTITITKTGTMTLTLTWTPTSADLDLYLTSVNCTASDPIFSNAAACVLLADSNSSTATVESFSRSVTAGDQFKFWVDSFSSVSTANWTVQLSVP